MVRPPLFDRVFCCFSHEDPPPEALLVGELDVYDPGAGDPPLFRIRKMGSRCHIDLIRPNVRSRLTEGGEIQHGSRIEVILQDTRRILLTMQMESDAFNRSDAVGGGSLNTKNHQVCHLAGFSTTQYSN